MVHGAQPRAPRRARSSPAGRRRLDRPPGSCGVGQRGQRVEGQQVRHRAQLAVLGGRGAEGPRAQVLGGGEHRRPGRRPGRARRADRHGLEPLGPEHGAEPAAPGVAPLVRDRGVADEALPGRARWPPPGRRGRGARAARGLGSAAGRPQTSAPSSIRAPSSSTTSTDGVAHAPRTTIASWPVSFPAIAKWLEASASLSRSVSGDLATTANFALVVSGVPTSGENTNESGASGASGSTPGGARA